MNAGSLSALLQLISSAVTPVVMISACSTLVLGINAKHAGISDRIRASAAECRLSTTTEQRVAQLLAEIIVFRRRFICTWLGLICMYVAICLFTCTTLIILLTQKGMMHGSGTITFFTLGIVLMLATALLEIAENALASRSLDVEMSDIKRMGRQKGREKHDPQHP